MLKHVLRYFATVFIVAFLFGCGGGDEEIANNSTVSAVPPAVVNSPVETTPIPPVLMPVDPPQSPAPVVVVPTPTPAPVVVVPTPQPPVTVVPTTTCVASTGTDYQVGPGKAYTSLDAVPWESLKAGDTVRIFYTPTPYKSKFMVSAAGTAAAPVRICGVKGANGERPIISGDGATTRPQLLTHYGNTTETQGIHQDRTVIVVKASGAGNYTDVPSYITIDGLDIRAGHPNYSYKDAAGVIKPYAQFGACVWVDRGHNILLKDNVISDCQMAVFSKSTEEGDFGVTMNLGLVNNYFYGNGIAGSDREHTTYTQSSGVLIEGNHYGPLRFGAMGNSAKDRSVGLVVRYNHIEEGARNLDMVEAEDFPTYAMAQPNYRVSYVYGNLFEKSGDTGSFFHYGGDHFGAPTGANWGEALFRRGTLYFFNNTVIAKGNNVRLFQISTTLETAEVYNNVFWYGGDGEYYFRQAENDTLSPLYTGDGILNFGKNWFKTGAVDVDQYHTHKGQVNGTANLIMGSTLPVDLVTMKPLAESVIVDASQVGVGIAAEIAVTYVNTDVGTKPRVTTGAGIDMGAFEY